MYHDSKSFSKDFYKNNCNKNSKELIELISSWRFIFLHKLNIHCSPNQYNNKTLFIDCHSGCMIEIMGAKQQMINDINKFFCKDFVNNIVIYPRFY